MVILDRTYDKELHQKVYVLKGEEGYARTTDVIASLVTFNDSDDAISNGRYGINIKVLRNIGDSSISIYNNDELMTCNDGSTLENIMWYEDMDNATIPDGMTWDSTTQSLTIGLQEGVSGYEDSGVQIFYEMPNHIKVKYMGNKQCMKSSCTFDVTKPTPSQFNTTLTINPSVTHENIYYRGESATIEALLKDGNDDPLSSKSVNLYIDDVLTSSSPLTTDTNGKVYYALSIALSNGLHTLKFEFEGEENAYYGSQSSYSLSYGYNIDVSYDSVWLNGTGTITATLTDYYENPISEELLYCDIAEYTTIHGTTNSNGVVTLTHSDVQTPPSSSLTVYSDYDDVSDTFSVNSAYLTTYDITGTTLETWVNGSALPLTVSASATDYMGMESVSLEGCEVTLTNATPSTVTLDSNGQATCYYNPTGAGDVTITANFQDVVSDTVGITDYHTVWANSQIYNGYDTMSYCSRQVLPTGWYLKSNSSSSTSKLYWYKRNGVKFDTFWVSFDVVSVDSDTTSIYVCGVPVSVSTGSVVSFQREYGQNIVYIFVDGLALMTNYTGEMPYVGFKSASNKGFTFNNLKIKTL